MGFIGSMFSGDKGAGYQAQGAPVLTGADSATASQANAQANAALNSYGLDQQQAFVNATQAQNGLGNQSQVFNQLQGVANGTGPNPAQAMLANTTGQNIAQQAALMAGQRGAGANVGLLARQAGMQGAGIQQNAAGQAAALQAQQSLGALNQLGGIAGQQVQQQQGALSNYANTANAYNQATQGYQNNVGNQLSAYNNANVGMQSNQNNNNAQIANTNTQGQQKTISGITGAAGSILGLAHGGQVPVSGPKSKVGQHLMAKGGEAKGVVPGKASVVGDSKKNDKVKALLSPGEIVLPRSVTQSSDPTGEAAKFVAAILRQKGSLN